MDEVDKRIGEWGPKRIQDIQQIKSDNAEAQSEINTILRLIAPIYPGALKAEQSLQERKNVYDQTAGEMIEAFDLWQKDISKVLRDIKPHIRKYDSIVHTAYEDKLKESRGIFVNRIPVSSRPPSQYDIACRNLATQVRKRDLADLKTHRKRVRSLREWTDEMTEKLANR